MKYGFFVEAKCYLDKFSCSIFSLKTQIYRERTAFGTNKHSGIFTALKLLKSFVEKKYTISV